MQMMLLMDLSSHFFEDTKVVCLKTLKRRSDFIFDSVIPTVLLQMSKNKF